jgi:hypothetical protein
MGLEKKNGSTPMNTENRMMNTDKKDQVLLGVHQLSSVFICVPAFSKSTKTITANFH